MSSWELLLFSFIFSWACVKNKCDLSVILIFSSFLLWWIMMSYAFLSLTPVWCEINVFLFFLFVFFYCFFVLLCYLLFIFLVIQSDLEQTYKKFDDNFHCAHVLIVKDYGKLGILYDEKCGGFYIKKVHPFLIRMDYVLIEK